MLVRYVACSARVGTAKQQKATGHNVCLCNIQHYGSCLPVPTQSHRLPVCLSSYFLGPSECVTRLRLVPWPLQGCSQPPTPNWVPAAFSLRLVLLGGRSGREASDSWHVPWPPQTADVERIHTQNWRVPSFLRGGLLADAQYLLDFDLTASVFTTRPVQRSWNPATRYGLGLDARPLAVSVLDC